MTVKNGTQNISYIWPPLTTSRTADGLANTLLQAIMQAPDSQIAWLYLTEKNASFHVKTRIELSENELGSLKAQHENWLTWYEPLGTDLPQQLTPPAILPPKLAALSFVFAPLHIKRENESPQYGLLIAGTANEDVWTDERLSWLAALCDQAAFVLHHLALEARLAERDKEITILQKALRIAAKGVHKLSQPLTIILGYSSLLRHMMPQESTQRPLVEKIDSSSQQVGIMVKKLGLVTQRPYDHDLTDDEWA